MLPIGPDDPTTCQMPWRRNSLQPLCHAGQQLDRTGLNQRPKGDLLLHRNHCYLIRCGIWQQFAQDFRIVPPIVGVERSIGVFDAILAHGVLPGAAVKLRRVGNRVVQIPDHCLHVMARFQMVVTRSGARALLRDVRLVPIRSISLYRQSF
jgi:hypothetical protein